jgi:hypothetical protein
MLKISHATCAVREFISLIKYKIFFADSEGQI